MDNLMKLHERWAQWAFMSFALRFPETKPVLYGIKHSFYILVNLVDSAAFQTAFQIFDNEIRPITADIRIVQQVPDTALLVPSSITLQDEYWRAGAALPRYQLQRILGMSVSGFPRGSIGFNNAEDRWEFSTLETLTAEEKQNVISATIKLNLTDDVHFLEHQVTLNKIPETTSNKIFKAHVFEIVTSQEMKAFPSSIRKMVEKDEDEWRSAVDVLCSYDAIEKSPGTKKLASCLFSPESGAELKLSELLTIYDEINLIPPRDELDWLEKHQLNLSALKKLMDIGRIKLVLPFSIENYSGLFDAIQDFPHAVILSRTLASKVIISGRKKDPLLYGPFTNVERAMLLGVLSDLSDRFSKTLVSSYGRHFEGQNSALVSWGAMANIGYGSGAHLGELIYSLTGKDARIELSTAGAGVEWALGMDSAYIPRNISGGYDETHNSLIVASYLSKTKMVPADPVSNRLHTIANELLSVSGISPLEVARNFNGRPAQQFRRCARELMAGTADINVLNETIDSLNKDILKFEKRTSFLSKLKIDALTAGVIAKPLNDVIDTTVPFGSIVTAWLYEHLKQRLPESEVLNELKQTLQGLALASSNDVVIISRARTKLRSLWKG